MTLKERLSADLIQARKSGDKARMTVLRLVVAGIKNAEIDKRATLDDIGVIEVLSREAKQHRESIVEFAKGNRQDLVDRNEKELAILMEYLPEQMSRDDIEALARQVMEQVGARGPADKGKLMGQLMPQLKGKADGKEVNEVVTELLAGG
jgi:uncharacterized protein YqeY